MVCPPRFVCTPLDSPQHIDNTSFHIKAMVHRGFSRACDRCRMHHKRCDETKPHCRKCSSQGHQCPGYRDVGGFMFRDQTHRIVANNGINERFSPSHPQMQRNVVTWPYREQQPATVAMIENARVSSSCRGFITSMRSSDIFPDTNQFVAAFYVECYNRLRKWTPGLRHGKYDGLSPILQNAEVSSPLQYAFSALAGQVSSMGLRRRDDSPWHLRTYHRAIRVTQEALTRCMSSTIEYSTTLLAIILLGNVDEVRSHMYDTKPSPTHNIGAATIVQQRGLSKENSERSFRFLVDALRRNLLVCAYESISEQSDAIANAFSILDPGDDFLVSPPGPSLDLLASRAFRLRRQLELLISNGMKNESADLFVEQIKILADRLSDWKRDLPAEWLFSKPHNHSPLGSSSGQPKSLHEFYPSVDVAILLNNWTCTRISVLRLKHVVNSISSCQAKSLDICCDINSEACGLARNVLAGAPYFLEDPCILASTKRSISFGDIHSAIARGAQGMKRGLYREALHYLLSALGYEIGQCSLDSLPVDDEIITDIHKNLDLIRLWFKS